MTDEYMPAGQYDERYFAYVDILGFQGLIERLKQGDTQFRTLWHLLKQVHAPHKFLSNPYPDSQFRAQSISDAVAISSAPTAEGLLHIFAAIESMAVGLLFEGFFIRGAIVKGSLYHDDNTVFGEALVRAYLLERDVVRYPRIMITRDVTLDLYKYSHSDATLRAKLDNYVHESDDGPSFLNVLRRASSEVAEALKANPDVDFEEDEELAYYGEVRNRIQNRFIASKDNPRHFEKVQWFAKYWNKNVLAGRGLSRISGPGLSPEPAVWG
jgi:hypothetical protein